MAKWLHSGRRRDICALLYDAGELRAQSLKNRLESHYDQRIDPGSFYGTLNSLVESGHLERHTEGLADVYALTDAGDRAIRDHYEWLTDLIDGGDTRRRGERTGERTDVDGDERRDDADSDEKRHDSGGNVQTNLKD